MLDLSTLLYTDDAAEHVWVTPDLVRQWANRGYLAPSDRDHRGRPRYRLGDVLDAERQTRTGLLAR